MCDYINSIIDILTLLQYSMLLIFQNDHILTHYINSHRVSLIIMYHVVKVLLKQSSCKYNSKYFVNCDEIIRWQTCIANFFHMIITLVILIF